MSETPYPPKGTMDSFVKTHNEQILRGKLYEMQPGPELDALIAEKVMGFLEVRQDQTMDKDGLFGHLKPYSTSMSAAWEVLEKLGYRIELIKNSSGKWYCRIYTKSFKTFGKEILALRQGVATEVDNIETAPHAICLAALKAVKQ